LNLRHYALTVTKSAFVLSRLRFSNEAAIDGKYVATKDKVNYTRTHVKTTIGRETTAQPLRLDEGLFELSGDEPLWIWAHTCTDPNCDCRDAFIVASNEGRDALIRYGLPVVEAWQARTGHAEVAARHDNLTSFFLNIDTVDVAVAEGSHLALGPANPRITEVVDRINGDVLDAMDRLWHIGKGYPDQREMVLSANSVAISDWSPGKMVAYGDAFRSVRRDLYFFDDDIDRAFEAIDGYCIVPDCACGDVETIFIQLNPQSKAEIVGVVAVNLSGAVSLKPEPGNENTLDILWAAFQKRHPAYLSRFAGRDADMKSIGRKMKEFKAPKIGRNDACPCGSGKKYKRCCGA
jgi:hypothetical protein